MISILKTLILSTRHLFYLDGGCTFKIILLFGCVFYSFIAKSETKDSLVIVAEPLYSESREIFQPINYKSAATFQGNIRLSWYQLKDSSSRCLYDMGFQEVHFNKGTHRLQLNLDHNSIVFNIDYSYIDVVKQFELVPPGNYKLSISITKTARDTSYYEFNWSIDSTLAHHSTLHNDLDKHKGALREQFGTATNPMSKGWMRLLGKKMFRKHGVRAIQGTHAGQSVENLYYQEWFLGYYVADGKAFIQQVTSSKNSLQTGMESLVHTDNIAMPSLNAQFRQANKEKRKSENRIEGNIDLNGNFGNGQPYGSEQDNNYEELHVGLNTEILKIPVSIEGYYTTQDQHRDAKASYFRIKYDVEKERKKLNEAVMGYRSSYEDLSSRKGNLTGILQQAISMLQQERAILQNRLMRDYHINTGNIDQNSTSVLKDNATTLIPDSLSTKKTEITRKIDRIRAIDKQVQGYQKQLNQFNLQNQFDKELSYDKIQKVSDDPKASAGMLAKAAKYILPESGITRFLSKITKFEAGILNTYESSYTMSGQTLKGGSIGYDADIAKLSVSAGRMEYISREGSVDRYNVYMGRADLKPLLKQKFSLLYYGYTPTRQILDDNKFIKADLAFPTFKQPVHIFSLIHSGTIAKGIVLETEGAYSYKKVEANRTVDLDHAAMKAALRYDVPELNANLKAEWEHVGRLFENNALAYTRAATERYTLAGQKILFGSFLTLGIQFNYLMQRTFLSRGYNVRWGFDIQTRSKQYPTVYLSYKPYSTFRRYDDTLAIAQRPVAGSVWTGRSNYQIKHGKTYHRFSIVYNQNQSTMDTVNYNSQAITGSYNYIDKRYNFSVTPGWMRQPLPIGNAQNSMSSVLLGLAGSVTLNAQWMINGGQDISVTAYCLQRYSATIGLGYNMKKLPLRIHMQARYSSLRPTEQVEVQHIWQGQLGLNWRFKTNIF